MYESPKENQYLGPEVDDGDAVLVVPVLVPEAKDEVEI